MTRQPSNPWRKRLGDLRQLIHQADETYFQPEMFRLNVNNAIQTSRTITFIIQKNKTAIPDFERWYAENVLSVLSSDPVMTWLKESRNQIEKMGDLEINSELTLAHVFSYTDEGSKIRLDSSDLLSAGLKKLLRYGRRQFPTGIFRDSAISIDRRWVANTLPSWELTDALHHGYSVLKEIVKKLDEHLGSPPPLAQVGLRLPLGSLSRRAFVKINDGKVYVVRNDEIRPQLANLEIFEQKVKLERVKWALESGLGLEERCARLFDVAREVFNAYGTHITIAFAFDRSGRVRQVMQLYFAEPTDKLIFWHSLAHMAKFDREMWSFVFVSEAWQRSLAGFPAKRVPELTILGESLHVCGVNADGELCSMVVPVTTSKDKKEIDSTAQPMPFEGTPNFLVPLQKVWQERPQTPAPVRT